MPTLNCINCRCEQLVCMTILPILAKMVMNVFLIIPTMKVIKWCTHRCKCTWPVTIINDIILNKQPLRFCFCHWMDQRCCRLRLKWPGVQLHKDRQMILACILCFVGFTSSIAHAPILLISDRYMTQWKIKHFIILAIDLSIHSSHQW